jgi:hypothetical protein
MRDDALEWGSGVFEAEVRSYQLQESPRCRFSACPPRYQGGVRFVPRPPPAMVDASPTLQPPSTPSGPRRTNASRVPRILQLKNPRVPHVLNPHTLLNRLPHPTTLEPFRPGPSGCSKSSDVGLTREERPARVRSHHLEPSERSVRSRNGRMSCRRPRKVRTLP